MGHYHDVLTSMIKSGIMSHMKYKHYSFDLWLTLIKSNPEFKRAKKEYFYRNFNKNSKSLEEVGDIIRQVDTSCNKIVDETGRHIKSSEMISKILSDLNCAEYDDVILQEIDNEIQFLFLANEPFIYSNHIIPLFQKIKDDKSTISILSNTGFIHGRTIRNFLKKCGLDSYISFDLYSDEIGFSKPSSDAFKTMIEKVGEIYPMDNDIASRIIHIGDNPIADIQGAKLAGINSFQVHSNNQSIIDII